jgi:O-6-methylguanine DNA methyltransferase
LATAEGIFIATYSDAGLTALEFPCSAAPAGDVRANSQVKQWHRETLAAVRAILAGRPPANLPPLDLNRGTDFQRRVWQALRAIPPGATVTYGELAAKVGRPGSARAVGAVCGANPIPLVVPCHRVVGAQGGLGGFSAGLDWKRKLLQREGVAVTG